MSSEADLHPREGARFLFELDGEDQSAATYTASIYTPDDRFGYRAEVSSDGTHTVNAIDTPATAELEKKLLTMARLLARDAKKRLADGLPPWPRRLLRWRGPK